MLISYCHYPLSSFAVPYPTRARRHTHINYGEQIKASRGSPFEDVGYSYCWCVLPAFVAATVDGRSLRTERWEEVPLAPPDMCVIFVMAAGES